MIDVARRLHLEALGAPVAFTSALDAHGSARRMLRLHAADGSTVVAVHGPDAEENRAFLSFTRTFLDLRLPVPRLLAADEAAGVHLVEDLGDVTLFRALTDARAAAAARSGGAASAAEAFPPALVPVYRRVLEALPRFQVLGGRAIDFSVAYPRAAFDRPSMQWDLDYFKYHFLKLAHVPFNEDRLHRDFERLVAFLLEADADHFLYRDFQSRNVMLQGDAPRFIDYQGGRRGALPYDVASLLYDAKAAIPDDVRATLLEHYLRALAEHAPVDHEAFRRHYKGFVVVRILQAMGAYGYRGFYERKPHFLASVPPAIRNLEALLADGLVPFDAPELRAVVERICANEALRRPPAGTPAAAAPTLRVRVGSFSYRRGLPDDPAGHGGGFVFDCRALDNPGRSPALAAFTGLDDPVTRFLDAQPGAFEFLAGARSLVEAQVRAYVRRGFTSLDVQFGCTGGRHRSVWAAERFAAALRDRFPEVRVEVEHRERERWAAAAAPAASAPVVAPPPTPRVPVS